MNHYYINNTYKINYEIKRLPFLPFIHQEIFKNASSGAYSLQNYQMHLYTSAFSRGNDE